MIQGITIEADSVVVKATDFDALCALARELEQLRGTLSLAEEGLANAKAEAAKDYDALAQAVAEIERLNKKCAALEKSAYPVHPDPTGKTREPPHCPSCSCEPQPAEHPK